VTRQSDDDDARTVFLIDGWSSFRRSLRLFLEATGHRVVGEADTVDCAAGMPGLSTVDVVVLEPKPDWSELDRDLRALRVAAPDARVVLLSSKPIAADLVLRAVDAGVGAYLTKHEGPAELLSALETASSRGFVMLPRSLLSGATDRRRAMAPNEVARGAGHPQLTRRELAILSLAAASHSDSEISRILWVTDQTIRFHLNNAYRKLGVTTRADAIASATRLGLLGWEDGQAA
jgi:DNA-binding NarL/FixJ family response regulator